MERGAWKPMVHRVAELDMTEVTWHIPSSTALHFHTLIIQTTIQVKDVIL